jgi:hypothetical protein
LRFCWLALIGIQSGKPHLFVRIMPGASRRLAVMREVGLTAVRNRSSAVHGVLWDLALAAMPALDGHESLSQGPLGQADAGGHRRLGAETGDCLFRRQLRARRSTSGLYG